MDARYIIFGCIDGCLVESKAVTLEFARFKATIACSGGFKAKIWDVIAKKFIK